MLTQATLLGGSWIFLAVVIAFLFSVIYGLFTNRGSGIANHPYGKVHGGAPGAIGSSSGPSGKDHHQAYSSRGMR